MQTPAAEPGSRSSSTARISPAGSSPRRRAFTVENGAIVANAGMPGHAFYDGPFMDHSFRNFELKVDVMTRPEFERRHLHPYRVQEKGWPSKGFEIQVNNTYTEGSRQDRKPLSRLGRQGIVRQGRRVVHRAHHRAGQHHHDQGERQGDREVDSAARNGRAAEFAGTRDGPARSHCRRTIRTARSTTRTSASSH